METRKRVVVLGGGYGGIRAAKTLAKRYRRRPDIEITLIDRNTHHTLMTELHEVAGGRCEPESVLLDLRIIFAGRPVRVVTDRATTVDFEAREVVSEVARYPYDFLVIGAGGEPEDYGIPGIKEHTLSIWSFSDAIRIRHHVRDVFRRAAREPDPVRREELLTFVVAGAGFTGVEVAGELLEWRRSLCAEHEIDESEVRVLIVEALERILTILPAPLQQKADRYLKEHRAEIMLKAPIVAARAGELELKDGSVIRSPTVIWTCGIQGCEFAGNLSLTKGKCSNRSCRFATAQGSCGRKECAFAGERGWNYVDGKRGRLLVGETMQTQDYPNVYVVGDLVWYVEGKSAVPQIVETALQTGETAAHNIIAEIEGREKKPFRPVYHGFMVSIGGRWGVAHVMGISLTGIFAIGAKHLINLHYLLGLAGVGAVWDYFKHHFLEVKHGRSIVGGLGSATVRIYWIAVLRVFLGVMWLVEGIKKILEGWLDPARIFIAATATPPSASAAATQTAATVQAATEAVSAASQAVGATTEVASAAVTQAADAVTAATQAVTQAVETVTAATQAVQAVTQGADAVTAATQAGQAATQAVAGLQPLLAHPLGIYAWLMDTFVIHAPFFFQAMIVLAEVAIGLALIGGLFTFLAAAASLGLCVLFTIGAMSTREILWFAAAAIAVMGGAGRGLGLDYWAMRWVQRWWNRTRFARRTYLTFENPRFWPAERSRASARR